MAETRTAAGLLWRLDGDAWEAADGRGRYQAVEYRSGTWTALHFPAGPACGCGRGALGGEDFGDFEAAATAAVRLAGAQ